MSAPRARADSSAASHHAVSLKVLRLSRPTFAYQTPLPATKFGNGLDIDPKASLAYPSAIPTSFTLAPVLTLPKSFGLAYVGQRFECTLCINNETTSADQKTITGVRVTADLQTPTAQTGIPLELLSSSTSADDGYSIESGRTVQFNLARELQEAGQHVLVVTVSYNETTNEEQPRSRTFRKLYQFVAQQLISIRSKVTERQGSDSPRQWIIEAQIENLGEDAVLLTSIDVKPDDGVHARELSGTKSTISLKPRDIQQVMFLIDHKGDQVSSGRQRLGQIHILWSGSMGDSGTVKTGWLLSKT